MNVILLSGGSGTRLWPLSNEVRSKQFIKIFKRGEGEYESMVQRMYRQIRNIDPNASVTIATSKSQVSIIHNQLGNNVGISIEPCRRDTFPAIALATAYLHDVQGISDEESVVVCPVDPMVEEDYFRMLDALSKEAGKGEANLVLMGMVPTYPSEKYGYIIPESQDAISSVKTFKEKPDEATAAEYISEGALWNGGIFAYKLKYVLNKARELCGTSDYRSLFDNYENLNKISFDYAVVEKEEKIKVMRFSGEWKDLGTWDTLTGAMSESTIGNATIDDKCENVHIVNELSIPVLGMGLKNVAIAVSPDGILVTDKESSGGLKKYVEDIQLRPMYEERVWGEYKVLDYVVHADGNNSLTKHLVLKPGMHISYQRHKRRSEIWTFVEGSGELTMNGVKKTVTRGDTAYILPEVSHAIKAITELHIIEVQIGDELTEDDIERLDYNWDEE